MIDQKSAVRRVPMKMADIARIAGVSPSTVSRALAGSAKIPEATRDAIEAIAIEHGYVINRSARNLRQSLTRTIGVAIPLGHEMDQLMTDPFFLRLFGHMADAIARRRYDTLLVREPSPDALWLQRLIRSQRADGYIIVGQSDQHEALNVAAQGYLPLVVGGGKLHGQRYCTIGSNNYDGGRLATEHLIKLGRKQIMFAGPADLPQVDMRFAGYKDMLGEHGIGFDPNLYVSTHFESKEARERISNALVSNSAVDGIFAASDGVALAAIYAAERHGLRCPEDIAIVGFDDTEVATQARPSLTTIRQDVAALGEALVAALFERIDGRDTASAVLPVELIVRDSAPRNQQAG